MQACHMSAFQNEPTTFIFRGYNPYVGGLKPSFFMVWGCLIKSLETVGGDVQPESLLIRFGADI